MKKVYVVIKVYWESSEITKVFDSKEKAQKFTDIMNKEENLKTYWDSRSYYDYEEYDLE